MHIPEMNSRRLPALLAAFALITAGGLHTAAAEEGAPEAAPAAAAEEAAAPASAAETRTPLRLRYRDREIQNQRIAQIREAAERRREDMERWRSARRWWNNPEAEDRRQWNRARSRWQRDMIEARRQFDEQARPDYGYRYRYWRAYP